MSMRVLQLGKPYPLGATVVEQGVNFAVFSEHATRVELCVYDERGEQEMMRVPLHGPDDGIFHGLLPHAKAGLVYAYRAHGSSCAEQGHRFNAEVPLLDPYAKGIVKKRDEFRAVVMQPDIPMQTQHPSYAASEVVIYEVHAKGFSQTLPEVPQDLRGSYLGLSHPACIAHFKTLGVTTLCLLPLQYHLDESFLTQRALTNYWGYNTLGFFCADTKYSTQDNDPVAVKQEFQQMVQALHEAGIEVVLDVVYNHTPEGNEQGSTISFRGLDNASWYQLNAQHPQHYQNHTGCGNTLNIAHPRVTQFVLDSLRYWVEVMGVDGFRFDLATVLGRMPHGFDAHAAFFTALRQDPVLAKARLIAEPWDIGADGYQLGHFPRRFMEWNDKYRDSMRRYWLNQGLSHEPHRAVSRAEFVRRFMASSDVFDTHTRKPTACINYIAVHDGYTLHDLVSYQGKHNWANGEENRDGRDNEPACNFGVEGETDNAHINDTRKRVSRALMMTLLLSQGTPMICAGDEMGKTQQGNNNAYCQDNATSWLDWRGIDKGMMALVQRMLQLRREHALLRPADWASAQRIVWTKADGCELSESDWHATHEHAISCVLHSVDAPMLFIAFNPHDEALTYQLPPEVSFKLMLDSSSDPIAQHNEPMICKGQHSMNARSVALFQAC
jgi:isoamylase